MDWLVLIGIIATVSAVLAIVLGVINDYSRTDTGDASMFFVGCSAVFLCIFGILVLTRIDKASDFRAITEQYNTTKALVESYEGGEYGNFDSLTAQIINVNNTVAKHKAYSQSKWVGKWYSAEIGALEPLKLGTNKH